MPEAKCPIEGCTQTFMADTELDARIKLIATPTKKDRRRLNSTRQKM
jgi:hypothetical protein